jgi:thiol-disulfide isomerase/thioredoxin
MPLHFDVRCSSLDVRFFALHSTSDERGIYEVAPRSRLLRTGSCDLLQSQSGERRKARLRCFIMLTPEYLADKFAAALGYSDYMQTGKEEHQRRWQQALDASSLTGSQTNLIGSFTRQMNVLVISGIWCGDCAIQGPLLQRIAAANPGKIDLRWVDRDEHKDLSDQLKINGGARVPVAIFVAEDFELCAVYGERPLSRYRAIARKQLGESCEIAIAAPDPDEHAATLQEWLNEFERIQLMLRISPRLRKKHGD